MLALISFSLILLNLNSCNGQTGRVVQTNFIEEVTAGYQDLNFFSGYLTVNKRISKSSLYFLFVGKQGVKLDSISEQDLLIYINASPKPDSASSSTASFFFENGPIRFNPSTLNFETLDKFNIEYDNKNKYIPIGWNKDQNVLYIDMFGQGLSYVDDDVRDFPITEQQVVDQIYNALLELENLTINIKEKPFRFFENYFRFANDKNRIFLFGESLAGKFVPTLAKYIHDKNQELARETFFNLRGIGIINGLVSPVESMQELGASTWNLGLIDYKDRIDIERQIMQMKQTYMSKKYSESLQIYEDIYNELLDLTGGVNLYNMFKFTNDFNYVSRYFDKIQLFFNEKKNLKQFTSNFEFVTYNRYIRKAFDSLQDIYMKSSVADVEFCVQNDIKTLVIQGQDDFISNNAGTLKWAESMTWKESADFNNRDFKFVCLQNLKEYGHDLEETQSTEGDVSPIVGYGKKIGNLQFHIINMAGRFVSLDTPARTYQIIKDFMSTSKATKETIFCKKQNLG